MKTFTPHHRPAFPVLALVSLLLLAPAAEAAYIGLEPDRLTALLIGEKGWDATGERLTEIDSLMSTRPTPELWKEKATALASRQDWTGAEAAFRHAAKQIPEARLGWAVSLRQLGRAREALEALSSLNDPMQGRLAYVRALLRLEANPTLRFAELREMLQLTVASNRDAFEMWLALNPTEAELEDYLKRSKTPARSDSEARWKSAEVLLRLGEPKEALRELGEPEPTAEQEELRNRVDYARARAYFQADADEAGQALYEELLSRLDEPTAERLYRDLAAITTEAERQHYQALRLEDKGDFFRRFWRKRHPLPAQRVNPRLGEQYRRLAKALAEYPLQSTGRGYFTDRERFLSSSPQLAYYRSSLWFDRAQDARYWVDHRGFVLLRHGAPDIRIGPRAYGGSTTSESWLITEARTRPYLFNFVKHPATGEFILVLNLGVAATRPVAADTAAAVAESLTRDYGRLYASRLRLHPVYRGVLEARSRLDLERSLQVESQQMASFANAALASDSTSYYSRENTLPMAVSVSNFYSQGLPGIDVDFAVDLSVVELEKLHPDSTLEATLLVYDNKWQELLTQVDRKFPLWPPPSGKAKTFVGNIQVLDLDPSEYRLVLQIWQADTARAGIARGGHETMYVHPGNMGLSDLYLRQLPVSDKSKRKNDFRGTTSPSAVWLPVPGRVLRRSVPAKIDFELYNLRADASGTARFEIEERLLTLYEKPGLLRRMAGYGSLAGQMFFPLYAFAAQAGGFALSQTLASETKGLKVQKRRVKRQAAPMLKEELQTDLSKLKPGIYTVYITVRDLVSNELTSRFLTLQIG